MNELVKTIERLAKIIAEDANMNIAEAIINQQREVEALAKIIAEDPRVNIEQVIIDLKREVGDEGLNALVELTVIDLKREIHEIERLRKGVIYLEEQKS